MRFSYTAHEPLAATRLRVSLTVSARLLTKVQMDASDLYRCPSGPEQPKATDMGSRAASATLRVNTPFLLGQTFWR